MLKITDGQYDHHDNVYLKKRIERERERAKTRVGLKIECRLFFKRALVRAP